MKDDYTQRQFVSDVLRLLKPNAVARRLGLSQPSVHKWMTKGCLPRTEWSGETSYYKGIVEMAWEAGLIDGGMHVTKEKLLPKRRS